jgi:hypothetical protein
VLVFRFGGIGIWFKILEESMESRALRCKSNETMVDGLRSYEKGEKQRVLLS